MNQKINLIRNLFSNNESEVLKVLENIKDTGYPDITSDLIKLYSVTNFENVKNETYFILVNLKNNDCIPYFIDGLKKYATEKDFQKLISSCWQNGLNFSKHLEYFIELVAGCKLDVAVEAFTVVEENAKLLNDADKKQLMLKAKELMKNSKVENNLLLNELEKLFQE